VVVDRGGELLDEVVELLAFERLGLEDLQQRLVALGMLLLAVLGVMLADGVLAPQRRVDPRLLRLGVRDVQRGERLARRVAVAARVAQVAQQRLEAPVVVEDQVDDVARGGATEVQRFAQGGRPTPGREG
jgi:hypothetical protein